jgi:hypothetical protein
MVYLKRNIATKGPFDVGVTGHMVETIQTALD